VQRETAATGAPGPICFGGTVKLKKPLYQEGTDFDPACLSPAEADELSELMKSQAFADNRVSYGPQVFPAPRKSNGRGLGPYPQLGV
jgi:hypothetical protein